MKHFTSTASDVYIADCFTSQECQNSAAPAIITSIHRVHVSSLNASALLKSTNVTGSEALRLQNIEQNSCSQTSQ